jgi:hypothetical protein
VLHGGYVHGGRRPSGEPPPAVEDFHMLLRDLYIPPGKIGYWQIAFRDEDARREDVRAAVESGRFSVDVLYGDYEGGQRVITRFGVGREDTEWKLVVVRHWQIDRAEPRQRG